VTDVDSIRSGEKSPTVRWWRRRPTADASAFVRRVWWVGQAQLYIAPAALLIGLLLFVPSAVSAQAASAGPWIAGMILIATALPFAGSGLALRAWAVSPSASTGSRAVRVGRLVGVVAGIAICAILLTSLLVYVILGSSIAASCAQGC
jgi:hypothetical protein